MGYDRTTSSSSSSGFLIAAVAVGVAMFIGLIIVGGAMVFNTRQASVAREMVVLETARAEAMHGEAQQQARRAEELAKSALELRDARREAGNVTAEFQVAVGETGTIRVGNEEVGLDEMVTRLTDGDQSVQTVVKLSADPQCPFVHVAAVIKKCREAGIQQVEVVTP